MKKIITDKSHSLTELKEISSEIKDLSFATLLDVSDDILTLELFKSFLPIVDSDIFERSYLGIFVDRLIDKKSGLHKKYEANQSVCGDKTLYDLVIRLKAKGDKRGTQEESFYQAFKELVMNEYGAEDKVSVVGIKKYLIYSLIENPKEFASDEDIYALVTQPKLYWDWFDRNLFIIDSLKFFSKEAINMYIALKEQEEVSNAESKKSTCNCKKESDESVYKTFSDALAKMKMGHRLARLAWTENTYIELQKVTSTSKMTFPYLIMVTNSGDIYPYVVTNHDLMAEDWYVM